MTRSVPVTECPVYCGRFASDGLRPGEHEFRVWHERVVDLGKSLVVTIKPGEESRSDLEYEPKRLKLEEAEVQDWSNRHIDTRRVPQPLVPRRAAPQPVVKPKDAEAEAAHRRIRDELKKLTDVPLRDVLTFLSDDHNIAIKFDPLLKEQAKDLGDFHITATRNVVARGRSQFSKYDNRTGDIFRESGSAN